ncbi:MAG TPA: hypothetical protein VMR34_02070 [Candidatus Saccharimonadales bacterium]|nr:hypothetical protein [Candidatus Saccharimonadales bacterium]
MGVYFPVISGETSLRADIEGLLTEPGDESVTERLRQLDKSTQSIGIYATFGAEIEFQFVPDPEAPIHNDDFDEEDFYQSVLDELGVRDRQTFYIGGEVIPRNFVSEPVILNEGKEDDEYYEIRTAPATSLEAIDRYWNTIRAIGTVAAGNGMLGTILSTHINAAIEEELAHNTSSFFWYMHSPDGSSFVAAAQYNLNSMYPLQIDAGVDSGIVVLEAFPELKDATTTIHDQRLEFRHPSVGIVDPRIDILAVLDAAKRAQEVRVSQAETRSLKAGNEVMYLGSNLLVDDSITRMAIWDPKSKSFVLPAKLDRTSRHRTYSQSLDRFVETVSGESPAEQPGGDNEQTLRRIIRGLTIESGKITVKPDHPYHRQLSDVLTTARVKIWRRLFRVSPEVFYDSPEVNVSRRRNIKRSSVVRRILGSSVNKLVEADESAARRTEILKNRMVYAGDE